MRAAEGRGGGNCRAGCEKGSKVRLVERCIGGRIGGIVGLMGWVNNGAVVSEVQSIWKMATEVCTISPAHALVRALTLFSERGPNVIGGALSEVQAADLSKIARILSLYPSQ